MYDRTRTSLSYIIKPAQNKYSYGSQFIKLENHIQINLIIEVTM